MSLKLLLDENVRKEIISFLEANKFSFKRVPAGSSDEEVAKFAEEEQLILLTHDLDFANIFLYPPEKYGGIIVIRILPPLVNTIIKALQNLLSTLESPSEYKGRLIILEPNHFRIWQK